MVISEIRSVYCDEDDLLHTVIKRIYEMWDPSLSSGIWKRLNTPLNPRNCKCLRIGSKSLLKFGTVG